MISAATSNMTVRAEIAADGAADGVQIQYTDMQGVALLQGGTQGAVQPVFQVNLASPLDGVRKQVAVEGGVLVEHLVQGQLLLRRDELVEADRPWRDIRPVASGELVVGIRTALAHRLENQKITCLVPSRNSSSEVRRIKPGEAAYRPLCQLRLTA
jgi:hypothetical protein